MFSQGAEISQLSCEIPDGLGMEQSRALPEAVVFINPDPENTLKNNRHITDTHFGTSLKTFEKKRISYLSKIKTEDEVQKSLLDSHEHRKKQSLDLQMDIEELSGNYQTELAERKTFYDRSKYYFEIVDVFQEHYLKAKEAENGINEDSKAIKSSFNDTLLSENLMKKKEEMIKSSISSKLEKQKSIIEENRRDIINTRKTSVNDIKSYELENDHAASSLDVAMKIVADREKEEVELSKTYNDLEPKIKSDYGLVIELQQKLNELMNFRSTNIQNSKLQLNTEQSINVNLAGKYKDLEEIFNTSMKEEKELSNLECQLKCGVKDLIKCRNSKIKEQEERTNQKCGSKNKLISFEEDMLKLKDVAKVNESLKNDVHEWKIKIKLSNSDVIEEDQMLISQQSIIENNSKRMPEVMSEKLDQEAHHKYLLTIDNELNIKIDDLKVLNEKESQEKLLINQNTEEMNIAMFNTNQRQDEDSKMIDDLISGLKEDISLTKNFIKKLEDETEQNVKNLKLRRSELECEIESLSNYISRKKSEDDDYLNMISEAMPIQQDLAELKAIEESLIEEISDEMLYYKQEYNVAEKSFNNKISETEKAMELHLSLINQLIKTEEESTNKIKEEIKATEDRKAVLERELSHYKSKLSTIKSYENQQRLKIINTDKKFRKINKEVKVTREDITDAINGKSQALKMHQSQNILLTPNSLDSNVRQPPAKKVPFEMETKQHPQVLNKVTSKRWVQPVHFDEYDFSEWNQ